MPQNSIQTIYQHYLAATGISTDSRKIAKGNVFFALKGPNFNGNQYAKKALELGASLVVIDEQEFWLDERTIVVVDVLKTLQELANYHRRQLSIPIIGIAGSNGKTTTKELIYAVLAKKFKTFATKGNLNNHIGVPLSILSISTDTEAAILELGANHVGELEFLCQIAEPDFGIVTNNGLDHLEGYGSFEGVVLGNSELYGWLLKHKGTVFVNSHDEILMRMASRFANPVSYGAVGDLVSTELIDKSFFLHLKSSNGRIVVTNLIGDYNQDNINAALCIGAHLGVDPLEAEKAVSEYVPSNNRSQLLQKGSNSVVLDCYNANPSSMQKSIESFAKMDVSHKNLLLGDMFELGTYSEVEHGKMVQLCTSFEFEHVYFCGACFAQAKMEHPTFTFVSTRTELEAILSKRTFTKGHFLIKGSRGMAMEKLVDSINE